MYSLILAYLLSIGAVDANAGVTVVYKPGQKLQPITIFRPMVLADTTGDDSGGDDGHIHP